MIWSACYQYFRGRVSRTLQFFIPYIYTCLILFTVHSTVVAAPLAGTQIDSQANTTFRDDATSSNNFLSSNLTRVVVGSKPLHVLRDDRTLVGPSLSYVSIGHSLHNTGNIQDDYVLQFSNQPADDYDLASLRLYADTNRNGRYDPGEQNLANGVNITLQANESFYFVLVGQIPSGVVANNQALINVQATSVATSLVLNNNDTIRVAGNSLVNVSTQVAPTQLNAGDVFVLTTQVTNNGTIRADALSTLIDGVPQNKMVVETHVPPNSIFQNAVNLAGGQLLYHIAGDPAQTYQSTLPANAALVDLIVVAFDNLPADVNYQLQFEMRLSAIASDHIRSQATVRYYDTPAAKVEILQANTTQIDLPKQASIVEYYTDASFGTRKWISSVGAPLYAQVNAAQCNQDASVIENITLVLDSKLTGDSETFTLTESAANSGQFRFVPNIPTADGNLQAVVRGNGQVEVRGNDAMHAQVQACGETIILADLLIDPYGIVFDSNSGAPVAGATISLIDVTGNGNGGNPGGLAVVFQADGVTPSPNPVVTNGSGAYAFPLVAPSDYQLIVSPPSGYGFPSSLPPALLPAGFVIDAAGSYGGNFVVSSATGPVRIDIPMDGAAATALFINKTVSVQNAQMGDFIDYRIDISNTSGSLLQGITINDALPKGFAYVSGSARLDGAALANPSGGSGPNLVFSLPDMADGTSAVLSYRVVVGPKSLPGKAINSAQAQSALPLIFVSNSSSAAVNIRPDLFGDEGFIIGKVFLDCNGNSIQESEELGVPGVHLVMENGNYVVTDAAGQYNFYGISAKTHVLRIDTTTLPFGIDSTVLSNRHANDPTSRFVDLKRGELHKANFPLYGCSDEKVKMVMGRRVKSKALMGEATQRITHNLPLDREEKDALTLQSSGTVDNVKVPVYEPVEKKPELAKRVFVPVESTNMALNKQMAKMDNQFAFVNINKGDSYPVNIINVQVKGKQGSRFALWVNGIKIPNKRVGKRSVLPSRQLMLWEYVGVALKPGQNILVAKQLDPFGNVRDTVKSFVIAPGELGKIHIKLQKQKLVANGGMVRLKIQVTDDKNRQISARIPLDLHVDRGTWMLVDLDQDRPGHQVFLEKGEGEIVLKAPTVPGRAIVEVSTGELQARKELDFLPHLRSMFAVGLVEGVINLRTLDNVEGVKQSDGFERELKGLSLGNDKANLQGRTAFYLKGKIKGEYLLSMRYDSDKESQDKLFRDIQPDEYYPIYGDASIKGFDAQSTSKLFVRIDKNRSYLLYGDYATQLDHPARQLSRYQRNLNGVKHHFENDKVKVDVFTSYQSSDQVIEEIPAQGISGPYQVNVLDAVENSERVEIITRDRNQASVVLEQKLLSRFKDYQFNAYSGELMFKSPVSSVDANLNPVLIRVTYEVKQGGKSYWSTGVSAEYKINPNVEVGADIIDDRSPTDSHHIYGANISAKIRKDTSIGAEIVQTQRDTLGSGLAHRLEIQHKGKDLAGSLSYGQTDTEFYNPSASLNRGRGEIRLKGQYKVKPELSLKADLIQSKDKQLGGKRNGVDVSAQYSFPYQIKTEVGLRHVSESAPADADSVGITPNDFTSLRAKVSNQLPMLPSLSLFAEYEQALAGEGNRAALGGEYTLGRMGRIYAHHEFISSLGNAYSLNGVQQRNISVIGFDSRYKKDARVYSEYRIREVVNGREAQAAMGLRHSWLVWQKLKLNAGIERISSFNTSDSDSTALNAAVQMNYHPDWKMSSNLEFRFSSQSDSFHNAVGLARKLTDRWSLLARNNIFTTDFSNGDYRLKDRLQLGMAYRQKHWYQWHGFGKYEYKIEKEDANNLMLKRNVHILTTHVNYQPHQQWILSGQLANKWVFDSSNGQNSQSQASLIGLRGLYEWGQKWDVGAHVSLLNTRTPRAQEYGLGMELGRILAKNLWSSLGFNFLGYSDQDLQGEDYTESGLYFRLRYKFDEGLFNTIGNRIKGRSQ